MNKEGVLNMLSMELESLNEKEKCVYFALAQMNELYKGDGELVRPGAEKHGVQVIKGDIFGVPSEGNYNFRIIEPSVKAVEDLLSAKKVAWLCEDYRQFAQATEAAGLHPGEDAVFGIAGGVAQPEVNRFNALVDLAVSLYNAKPELTFVAGVHTGICGGAEHFSGGKMSPLSSEDEKAAMLNYRNLFVKELVDRGVPEAKIETGMAVVNGHTFDHWE